MPKPLEPDPTLRGVFCFPAFPSPLRQSRSRCRVSRPHLHGARAAPKRYRHGTLWLSMTPRPRFRASVRIQGLWPGHWSGGRNPMQCPGLNFPLRASTDSRWCNISLTICVADKQGRPVYPSLNIRERRNQAKMAPHKIRQENVRIEAAGDLQVKATFVEFNRRTESNWAVASDMLLRCGPMRLMRPI